MLHRGRRYTIASSPTLARDEAHPDRLRVFVVEVHDRLKDDLPIEATTFRASPTAPVTQSTSNFFGIGGFLG